MKNISMNQVALNIFREISDKARYSVWDMKEEVHLSVRSILVDEIRIAIRLDT